MPWASEAGRCCAAALGGIATDHLNRDFPDKLRIKDYIHADVPGLQGVTEFACNIEDFIPAGDFELPERLTGMRMLVNRCVVMSGSDRPATERGSGRLPSGQV